MLFSGTINEYKHILILVQATQTIYCVILTYSRNDSYRRKLH